MKIKVRLLADFKEISGKKDFEIEIEREMTIKELIKLLIDNSPGMKKLTKYPENYSVLLNGTYSRLTETLKENDVIDLFRVLDGG